MLVSNNTTQQATRILTKPVLAGLRIPFYRASASPPMRKLLRRFSQNTKVVESHFSVQNTLYSHLFNIFYLPIYTRLAIFSSRKFFHNVKKLLMKKP